MGDNRWHFDWAMPPENGLYLSVALGLLRLVDSEGGYHYGVLPDTDLFRDGVLILPTTEEETLALLDRNNLAAVNNPDPADRLHLRAEPSRSARSLGKFYNGTIVHVLAEKGDWVKVRIGTTDLLTGWMMRKYLVFGNAIDSVDSAFADMLLHNQHKGSCAYADARCSGTQADMPPLTGWETIIGVVDAQGKQPASYILIDKWGSTGYVPQSWYWPGNG